MDVDQVNAIISRLRAMAEEAEAENDLGRWAALIQDASNLISWDEGGRQGECPVDLAPYDVDYVRSPSSQFQSFTCISTVATQPEAREWDAQQHGLLTYHLLQGLKGEADRKGKGSVSVRDLANYTQEAMRHRSAERGQPLQAPIVRVEGIDDVILASFQRESKEQSLGEEVIDLANPFDDLGRITDPTRFFDRKVLLQELQQLLVVGHCVALVGEPGVGKSSVLYHLYLTQAEWSPRTTVLYIDLQAVLDEKDFCVQVLTRLGKIGSDLGTLRKILKEKHLILLLDEVHRLAQSGPFSRLRNLLRSLAEDNALTMAATGHEGLMARIRTEYDSPFFNIFMVKRLEPFSPETIRALLAERLHGTGVTFTEDETNELLEVSGGHPSRLHRAAAELYRRRSEQRNHKPIANPYVVGVPARGSLFVGREAIIEELEKLWSASNPFVFLHGQRRMGKTSILLNLTRYLNPDEALVVNFDMMHWSIVANTGEMLYSLAVELHKILQDASEKSREIGIPKPVEKDFLSRPYTAVARFLKQVEQIRAGRRIVITIDEFELIEKMISAARLDTQFLDFWRSMAQSYPWLSTVFAGLHSIEELTADFWRAFFGSAVPLKASFLSRDAAWKLITQPVPQFPLQYEADAVERIIEATHRQPYLVQLVCYEIIKRLNHQVLDQGIERKRVLTLSDAEAVIGSTDLWYRAAGSYFSGIWQQAEMDEPSGQKDVLLALTQSAMEMSAEEIARVSRLAPEKVKHALEVLARHDVVEEAQDRWRLTIELMRPWIDYEVRGLIRA